jgi:hypothetical protein
MPIIVEGIREIRQGFQKFEFAGKRIQARFLRLIGESTVILLKQVTPVDSGELSASWRVTKQGKGYVEVGTEFIGQVEDLERGTKPHIIRPTRGDVLRFEIGGQEIFTTEVRHPGTQANPFLDNVARTIHTQVISILKQSLAENHPYFLKLKGGKGRERQQVGRTSAGFRGGVSFAGRSTLVRAGTGRRQLKRRLSLRRRRGSLARIKKDTKVKLG